MAGCSPSSPPDGANGLGPGDWQDALMAAPVRYGIIGTGMMGCEHLRDLAHLDDAEVVAISDPVPDSLSWGHRRRGTRKVR